MTYEVVDLGEGSPEVVDLGGTHVTNATPVVAGPRGAAGAAGAQGPKGDAGDAGPAGSTGPAGSVGATGPAGPKGDKGDPGDIGPTGPQGADGADGGDLGPYVDIPNTPIGEAEFPPIGLTRLTAYTAEGDGEPPAVYVANSDQNISRLLTVAEGQTRYVRTSVYNSILGTLAAADGAGDGSGGVNTIEPGPDGSVLTADSTDPLGIAYRPAPTGPQGDTGPQGPQGVKGDKGDTGAQGPIGNTGPTGAAGPAGPGVNVLPSDHGFKMWSGDPVLFGTAASAAPSGTLHLIKLWNRTGSAQTISSATTYVSTAGSALTNVGFTLYATDGTLLTSSVNANGATTAAFQTTGAKTVTFPVSQTIADGAAFYVGWWFTGTTSPLMERCANGPGAMNNIGLSAPNFRIAGSTAGLTTTAPNPFGTQVALNVVYWVGIS